MSVAARYRSLFARLASRHEGAFVPFLVLGDPDPPTSLELVRTIARAGADALELGLPFSDPIADGSVIQAAAERALAAGTGAEEAFGIVKAVRQEFPDLPIGLLVYANLVMHQGADRFYRLAAEAGADSVLIADAPFLESEGLSRAARRQGVATVLMAPPNTGDQLLTAIAARSEGYLYVTSRPGVTGADDRLQDHAARLLGRLKQLRSAPPLLGFGIATPAHVRQALAMGAAGAICGSAMVRHIPSLAGRPAELLETLSALTVAMKEATRDQDCLVRNP